MGVRWELYREEWGGGGGGGWAGRGGVWAHGDQDLLGREWGGGAGGGARPGRGEEGGEEAGLVLE
jgi:hypothetical protein